MIVEHFLDYNHEITKHKQKIYSGNEAFCLPGIKEETEEFKFDNSFYIYQIMPDGTKHLVVYRKPL